MHISSPGSLSPSIAERFAAIRQEIATLAIAAGRDGDSVVLTAVSKTQDADTLNAALATGQRVFGENRVQEAQAHWAAHRAILPDLELRLIGPLQTNKALDAVALFDVIETLDRERLARALAQAGQKAGRAPRVLVQINTGEEPQKAGALPADADALIALARDRYGLAVEGLMAIPPVEGSPQPHFEQLARIANRNGLSVLSMGMSGDYGTAIRQGATHVRLGTALFGARHTVSER